MSRNKAKKNRKAMEKLDASKMTGAEVLEAVGAAEPLEDTLIHAEEQPPTPEADPETESDIQKKIAEIQKQRMEKIRAAMAASQIETAEEPQPVPAENPPVQEEFEVSAPPEEVPPPVPAMNAAPAAVAVAERSEIPESEPPQEIQEALPDENAQTKKVPAIEETEPAVPAPESHPKEAAPVKKKSSGKKKAIVRKKNRAARTGAMVGVSVAGLLILSYFIGAINYQDKFLPHTYINSLAVDGMTTEEAHNALLEEKEVKDLTLITPKGEEVIFPAQDFKAAYTIPTGSLDQAANEGNFNWVSKLFNSSEYAVKYDYTYSPDDLRAIIQNHNWGSETSQNAKIVRSDSGQFEIIPETLGDQFDSDMLIKYVMAQLEAGKSTINMEESGCYEQFRAKVTEQDLQPDLEIYNRFANCNITFDFDDRKKYLDSDTIISWLLKKDDGSFVTTSGHEIPVDQDAVAEFVSQMADETDTYGKDHEFYATLDGWITVPWTSASCYGWQINQKATVAQILNLIQDGQPVVVEPVYTDWGKGYTRKTDDIGTTYIEVDISAQHFWYYRNNEVIMDYDVVSGTETMSSRRTPRGVCKIVGHAAGVVLGTYAIQGYEQWVDYWMPFNYLGCGFHDLSRGAYGGSIYMYNGSHGCLNMRWSQAKHLYSEIEDGLPVIVHD